MSKLNMVQVPVVQEFLECFEAKPGHSLVYFDVNAIEPHVLTEFSQDPRMLSLYGEGVAPNDIYLFFGAHTALFKDEILKYYDPSNPTKESVALAKEKCPAIRQVLKIAVLGLGYNMGPKKLKEGINLAGFKMSLWEAKAVSEDYWRFFAGIKNFEARLLRLHDTNGGYIVNGRGRPLAIANDYTKDVVNRFVQSTGHDVLMYYIKLLDQYRVKHKIPMRPWLVDEHDATVWEVPDVWAGRTEKAFTECLDQLNKDLGWGIKFKGKIKVGKSLAIKV